MNTMQEKTIGETVAQDYRTAAVFEKYGIDFCCQGNRNIFQACTEKNIDPAIVQNDLNAILSSNDSKATDYNSWPLDLLADYIEKKHHRYVDEKIPVIRQYLAKLCQVHGNNHPELFEIAELFNDSASELTTHMKKEEFILFPFVRRMTSAQKANTPFGQPPFGTVLNPVQMMMREHDAEGERFRKISKLSNNYAAPSDACNTYKVTYALLKEFEDDLHLHIHLENNILFPKAIEMENKANG